LTFIKPGTELIFVLVADIIDHLRIIMAYFGDIRLGKSFFATIEKLTGDEGIVAMVFNPLIGIIVATDKRDKKMAVCPDGDQSISPAKIVLDAIFYPQLTFSGALAQDRCTMTSIVVDLIENDHTFAGSQLSFFACLPQPLKLFFQRPRVVDISNHKKFLGNNLSEKGNRQPHSNDPAGRQTCFL
jgi:hypothetical protein